MEIQDGFRFSLLTSVVAITFSSFMPFIYRYLVDNFNSLTVKSFVVIIALYGIAKIGAIIFNNISFFLSEKPLIPLMWMSKLKCFPICKT